MRLQFMRKRIWYAVTYTQVSFSCTSRAPSRIGDINFDVDEISDRYSCESPYDPTTCIICLRTDYKFM